MIVTLDRGGGIPWKVHVFIGQQCCILSFNIILSIFPLFFSFSLFSNKKYLAFPPRGKCNKALVLCVTFFGNVLVEGNPWVNFINVLMRSFYSRRSQKCKKLLNLTVFFALLGSGRVKAARQHIDEIDPSFQLMQLIER